MHTKKEKEKFWFQEKLNYKWTNKQTKNIDKGNNGKRELRRNKREEKKEGEREREKKKLFVTAILVYYWKGNRIESCVCFSVCSSSFLSPCLLFVLTLCPYLFLQFKFNHLFNLQFSQVKWMSSLLVCIFHTRFSLQSQSRFDNDPNQDNTVRVFCLYQLTHEG